MKKKIMVIIGCTLFVVACGKQPNEPEMYQQDTEEETVETSSKDKEKIEMVLKDKNKAEIGTVTLVESNQGLKLNVMANHLEPGNYGIHIHEAGICESPNFESAEGHFNPDDREHGFYQQDGPHKGDMENLKVEEDGSVNQTYLNELVTLEKDKPNSLITEKGTSIIIHEKEDDYISQPAGDAGARIYCGVISPPAE